MMTISVQSLFTDFAARLSISAPKQFEFPLKMNFDDITVVFDYDAAQKPDTLFIHSSLGVLPPEYEHQLYAAFLEANLFWSGTADATIGVNSATKEAIIAYPFNFRAMTGEALVLLVEQFTVLTELWLRFVDKPPIGSPSLRQVNKLILHNKG